MQDTPGEVRTNSKAIYSSGPLHMDEQRLDEQLEPIYHSFVLIQDLARKNCRERWTLETGDENVSEKFVLSTQYDDDDDEIFGQLSSFLLLYSERLGRCVLRLVFLFVLGTLNLTFYLIHVGRFFLLC